MLDLIDIIFVIVKALLGLAVTVVAVGATVLLLDMAFPDMNRRPELQVQVVKRNGYTCVKVQGEKASTCTKDSL